MSLQSEANIPSNMTESPLNPTMWHLLLLQVWMEALGIHMESNNITNKPMFPCSHVPPTPEPIYPQDSCRLSQAISFSLPKEPTSQKEGTTPYITSHWKTTINIRLMGSHSRWCMNTSIFFLKHFLFSFPLPLPFVGYRTYQNG